MLVYERRCVICVRREPYVLERDLTEPRTFDGSVPASLRQPVPPAARREQNLGAENYGLPFSTLKIA